MISKIFKENNDRDSLFIYLPNFFSVKEQEKLMNWMNGMNNFQECDNFQKINISRYQKWYQRDGEYFCKKWKNRFKRWESFEYDETLLEIENKVNLKVNEIMKIDEPSKNIFNSCLINKYLNGSNYIRNHRDSIDSFGEYPIIAGLSIGDTRCINFNRIVYNPDKYSSIILDKTFENFNFELESGSLFIMGGSSQKYFVHEIPKKDESKLRYSLTFRKYL